MHKVVVRLADGRKLKGTTNDFLPGKDTFHLIMPKGPHEGKIVTIPTKDLKALFFVKTYKGNPDHEKQNDFDPTKPPVGRKIKVVFKDGEVLVGTTTGYQPGRPGLFIVPADPDSNNERCYVFATATKSINFI